MKNQRSFSSTSFTYDVFLTFYSDDTRYGFSGNLWKSLSNRGINTFIDNKEETASALFNFINESRIAIIVFSNNYAFSSFCLELLAYILDNFLLNHRFIFPIFYDVDPAVVRNQSGIYSEAFARHEKKFNTEEVKKWRNVLRQVATLSGFHFKHGDGYEFEFIERIVEEVSSKFELVPLYIANYTVGLDSRLEEVCSLLELGSKEVLTVGIYGVGGIGKTILARAVYNKIVDQFEAVCFLPNIRENSNMHGLVHLQNRLLSEMVGLKDIQLGNASKGVSVIKYRLRRMKVLLILDDVDTLEQLEALVGELDWFGPGSRVIITTRDKHLLAFHKFERRYEVQELNHVDALELLSHNVFKQGIVDLNYKELLNQVVTYASGLPLALEVIGSCLFGKSVDQWRHVLDRFEQIPPNNIQNILRVSFDALDQEVKNVFLDITCCFKGYELTDIEDILRARYGHNMKYHIEVLIETSLINISLDGKVTAHPLIENMGKEIVHEESPNDPGRRSRLWFRGDIVQVLKNDKGTSNIEIIHLDSPIIEDEEAIEWDGEAFEEMPNLRILVIRKCHFSKAPKYLPNSLKVLEWWRYPSEELPSDFDAKKLVTCKLPNMGFMLPELTEFLQISHTEYQAETTWRLVGLMSSVVGLSCYAQSPSFNRLIGNWKAFKFFLYGMLSLAILTTILFAKQSSLSTRHVQLKTYMSFTVLIIISVYSFLYDRAVNGKPETLSIVSNAAFSLVSLSLHKLIKFGFEIGMFSYFLGCFAIQLLTINWMLIFVAIIFGFPLFVMHSSLNSGPEVASGGQFIH